MNKCSISALNSRNYMSLTKPMPNKNVSVSRVAASHAAGWSKSPILGLIASDDCLFVGRRKSTTILRYWLSPVPSSVGASVRFMDKL